MSGKSKRSKKQSSRTTLYAGVLVVAVVIIAIGGFYVYSSGTKSITTNTTTNSNSTTTSAANEYAVMDTSQGTIVIQLFPQVAPKTVANFVSLANSGFYDNLVWHRIVAGFVIQTGDPNTKGAVNSTRSTWGSGDGPTSVPLEVNSAYTNNVGYVALAHTSTSTSGSSQFYINLADNSDLNGQYTVFGKVVSGMNVVDAIGALPVYTTSALLDQPVNAQDALLISITIQSTP